MVCPRRLLLFGCLVNLGLLAPSSQATCPSSRLGQHAILDRHAVAQACMALPSIANLPVMLQLL